MKNIVSISTLCLALVAITNPAFAAPIPVGNFSFENPVIGPSDPGPGEYIITTSIPDWSFSPAGGDVTGVGIISGTVASAGSSDAINYAFLNIEQDGPASITYTGMGADALPSIAAGTNYTLKVALINRDGGSGNGIGGVEGLTILANNIPVATLSFNETQLPVGTFTDESVTLSAATISSLGLSGETLGIKLTGTQYGTDAFNQPGFDNVRLSDAVAPEPSTWALMLAGVAVLGFGMRRKGALLK